nr:hypothetical protein [Tanacetum cinerariifolium]
SSSNTDSTNEPVSAAASVSAIDADDLEEMDLKCPTKPDLDLSLTNRASVPIIEDWVSDSEDESETKAPQKVPSFVQPTENHAHRGNHKQYAQMTFLNPQRHVVPAAVLTQSKLVPINVVPINVVPINAVRPVSTAVPKLKKMRIEQYFLMADYSLWEVILNDDSPAPTRVVDGVLQPVAPTTAEQRNKTDLEEQSLDDLFNSLKIYEAEVKSSSSASTTTQKIAFVSSSNTDSTIEPVSAAVSVSAIDADDLEEMDLKWECRSSKDTRRNGAAEPQRRNVPEPNNYAHMAFSSSGSSSDNETDHPAFNVKLSPTKPNQDLSLTNRASVPIIEDWVSDSEDESETKAPQKVPNFVQSTEHVVPAAVLTQSKLVPINVVPINAVRPISTVFPKLKVTRPRQHKPIVTKPNSPTRRHITHSPSPQISNSPLRVTAVLAPVGNPRYALKDKGVIDSGCSRHMTGNMSYLSDFEELNGGYVAFGG